MAEGSPLRRLPPLTETPWLKHVAPATRFILRGAAPAYAAAGDVLGFALSEVACRAACGDGRAGLWLGPDEQLLIAPESEHAALTARLSAALKPHPHSLVDISHRQGAIEVRGPHAAIVLNGGCPLDLDLEGFPVGMCTRTVFSKADIVLWRTAEECFHVEIWRSFTAYVTGLLLEFAIEYGG